MKERDEEKKFNNEQCFFFKEKKFNNEQCFFFKENEFELDHVY